MGNKLTSNNPSLAATGKVILSDGSLHVYDAPLTVAELMLEYPQQVVVEYKAGAKGNNKPSPLPADEKLDRQKLYIMLPVRKGKPASLTSLESQQLLLRANNVLKSPGFLSSTTGVLPFLVRICPASRKSVAIKNRHAARREEFEGNNSLEKEDYFEKMLEMGTEFMTRQVSGKGWKPSLDTIVEKGVKPKVLHWLS